ncbi:MAG TPA: heparan-alpha-glucosaminide N-acetyltransferase [Casimicrobiaceae bacterium]|nr:heparan-alpha-glucosaminide N-acetyltransferase [Casimicrobiaceae bacterium]
MAGARSMTRRTKNRGRSAGGKAGSHAGGKGDRRVAAKAATTTPAATTTSTASEPLTRIRAIDAMRGTAICLMIVYHAAFDLNWFHIIDADFNHDRFWLASRDLIVSSFLLLVGVSLVLARRAGNSPRQFWRRIALVAACALLVTVGSYVTFPKTFITFGILHCIVVSSILGWPLVRFPRAALIVGIVVIVVGATIGVPLFDLPWLNWVGLMTFRPATEDYVPLLPWFGVVLVGIGVGWWLLERRKQALQWISRASPRWLTWLGRHSLLVYMVHQPIMVGVLRVLHG